MSGHGVGTVFYDESRGRFVAQLDVGRSATGGRRRAKRTATTEAGAKRALKQMIAEQEHQRLATGSTQTMEQFARFYLRKEADPGRKTTVATYEYLWNHYAKPIIGHRRVRDLTSQEVTNMLAILRERGLSVSTIKRVRGVVHLICAAAVRHEIIVSNPVSRVPPPRKEAAATHVQEPLTLAEAQQLLAAVQGHSLEAFVHLALATGMRRGEILGLKWSDVDYCEEAVTVSVRRSLVEGSRILPDGSGVSAPTFNPPKTRNGLRTIPLAPQTVSVLGRQRARQSKQRLRAGDAWQESGLVFTNELGGALWPSNVYKAFQRLLKEVGIRHVRIHDLRHTTAVLMLIHDVPLEQISQTLGHSTLEITKDIYANHVPELIAKATLTFGPHLYGDVKEAEQRTGTDDAKPAARRSARSQHSRKPGWLGDR